MKRKIFILFVLFAAAALVAGASGFIGLERITPAAFFGEGPAAEIFWRLRLPRVLTAFVAGAGLSVSGTAFQAMFRNSLATPFTLGVAGGAAFGASVSIRLGLGSAIPGLPLTPLFSFGGALFSIFLVYGITRLREGFSTTAMLLAGVAVSLFFSSLILFMQYTADFTEAYRTIRWIMGSLDVVGFGPLGRMLPFVAAGSAAVFIMSRELNLLSTGTELAASRGVDVRRTKVILFFVTSLMVGGVVAVSGPIGFVGMIIPHICRLIIGHDHAYLMPASLLSGGLFLTLCDTLSRTLIAPAELPAGIVTSLVGAPFFIWLLVGGSGRVTGGW